MYGSASAESSERVQLYRPGRMFTILGKELEVDVVKKKPTYKCRCILACDIHWANLGRYLCFLETCTTVYMGAPGPTKRREKRKT